MSIYNIDNALMLDKFMGHTHPTGRFMYNEWNQLMPVVEKIGSLPCINSVNVSTLKTRVWFTNSSPETYFEANGDSMILKCFNTVVMFIKWYNASQKPLTPQQ